MKKILALRSGWVLPLVLSLLTSPSLFPQGPGQLVDVFEGASQAPITQLLFRDGSQNTEYICVASSRQPIYTWAQASKAITSIVVSTNTGTVTTLAAHGLSPGVLITISGVTTDTDLNGTYYVQTVPTTATLTITTASVSDATYTDATQVITTTAPRSTAPIWNIRKISYTTTYMDRIQNSPSNSICANRATTTGATKVTYQ